MYVRICDVHEWFSVAIHVGFGEWPDDADNNDDYDDVDADASSDGISIVEDRCSCAPGPGLYECDAHHNRGGKYVETLK